MSENKKNGFHPQAALLHRWVRSAFGPNGLTASALKPSAKKTASVHALKGNYEPSAVMSKVYNPRDKKSGKIIIKDHFFNLETHKISALIPELRFFKVIGDKTTPFYFPISSISPDEASQTAPHTLGGSGIKSFSVTYRGTDPFTAPKYLTADLVIYVDNVSLIFAEPPSGYARLADLFTISIALSARNSLRKVNIPAAASTLTPGDLRRPIEVAATLGYTFSEKGIFSQAEIEEIRESNLTLRMNVTQHNIQVNQDGSAEISVSYTARIGDSLGSRLFSITDSKDDVTARADILSLFREGVSKANETSKKVKPPVTEASYTRKAAQIRKIMEILEKNQRIHTIQVKEKEMEAYTKFGIKNFQPPGAITAAAASGAQGASSTTTATTAAPAASRKKSAVPSAPPAAPTAASTSAGLKKKRDNLDLSMRVIHYITFGDLIQAFFEKSSTQIEEAKKEISNPGSSNPDLVGKSDAEKAKMKLVLEENEKKLSKFRVLLADTNIKINSADGSGAPEMKRINLADVPISLALYSRFMLKQAADNYDKTYTIYQFLNDATSNLLPSALSEFRTTIAPGIVNKSPSFKSTTHTGGALTTRLAKAPTMRPEEVPAGISLKDHKFENQNDYFIIFQETTSEFTSGGDGSKRSDSEKGVYHFEVGKNRGLIKSINFSRFDVPYAQEQLMTNQVGLYDELKMPYKASISMVGNNLFMPGSQIYINPSNIGFGLPTDTLSASHRLGLGGYYTVIDVSTSVDGTSGVATTELGCSFGAHVSPSKAPLSDSVPGAAAADVLETATISTDSDAKPTEVASGTSGAATSAIESRLLAGAGGNPGVQPNLAAAISAHFDNLTEADFESASWADWGASMGARHNTGPFPGVEKVKRVQTSGASTSGVLYKIDHSFITNDIHQVFVHVDGTVVFYTRDGSEY